MTLMDRRRALMMTGEEEITPLYRLKDYNFDGTVEERINTGVKLFPDDTPCTLLIDLNLTENPTSGAGSIWCIGQEWNQTKNKAIFKIGKINAVGQFLTFWWQDAAANTSNGMRSDVLNRKRIAMTHEENSNIITLRTKDGTKSVVTKTISSSYTPSTNNTFFLGSTGNYALPKGKFNLVEIYHTILSNDLINAFFL